MNKTFALAGLAAAAFVAAPASAATVVTPGASNPGWAIILSPAGPGAISGPIGFDVSGDGSFAVTFTFSSPFSSANSNASASFNFDPDMLIFTGGDFSGSGVFTVTPGPTGSSIQVDRAFLPGGPHTLNLYGTLNSPLSGNGNDFARVGGSVTLTGVVPEPATWALFILGFGAIGATLRRRSGAVRVSKAKLTFA